MKTLKAQVSDEAHAGWQRFAKEIGVPVSAAIEAAGLLLARWYGGDRRGITSPKRLTELARQVAFERRQRGSADTD